MSAAVAHISRPDKTEPVVVQDILNLRDMQDGKGHSHVVSENPNWAKITTFVTLDLVGQIVCRPRFIKSAAQAVFFFVPGFRPHCKCASFVFLFRWFLCLYLARPGPSSLPPGPFAFSLFADPGEADCPKAPHQWFPIRSALN